MTEIEQVTRVTALVWPAPKRQIPSWAISSRQTRHLPPDFAMEDVLGQRFCLVIIHPQVSLTSEQRDALARVALPEPQGRTTTDGLAWHTALIAIAPSSR